MNWIVRKDKTELNYFYSKFSVDSNPVIFSVK